MAASIPLAHPSLASGIHAPEGLGPSEADVQALSGASTIPDPTSLGWWANNPRFQILRWAILSPLLLHAPAAEYFHSPLPSLGLATPIGEEARRSAITTRGHRSRELAFQKTHPEALRPFAGQWVVLEGETIVAHGNDPARVVSDARSKGIRIPFVVFVEQGTEDVAWLGL